MGYRSITSCGKYGYGAIESTDEGIRKLFNDVWRAADYPVIRRVPTNDRNWDQKKLFGGHDRPQPPLSIWQLLQYRLLLSSRVLKELQTA